MPQLPPKAPPPIRTTLLLSLPSILIGALTAVMLIALTELANGLQDVIWTVIPDALGVDPDSGWWIFGTLTTVGLLVGLIVWLVPGHAGPDPATTGLVSAPLRLRVLPGLFAVVLLGLAGGVSLGPENPIIAINTAIVVALMTRVLPSVSIEQSVMLSVAGTIGAMFGTPVAAALIFTGMVGMSAAKGALWDRLFLPVVAAGSGAIVMALVGAPSFSVGIPPLGSPEAIDLVSGVGVAVAATLLGIAALLLFPLMHKAFQLLRHPVLYLTLGGALLGVLGAIGGTITLFKGAEEMKQLTVLADGMTTSQLDPHHPREGRRASCRRDGRISWRAHFSRSIHRSQRRPRRPQRVSSDPAESRDLGRRAGVRPGGRPRRLDVALSRGDDRR